MRTRSVSLVILATLSILAFATFVMLGQPVTIAKAAPAGAPLLQAATPTPAPTSTPPAQTLPTQYSPESVGVVAGVFVLLALLFVLLFWWSNKLDQAGYLGSLYRDTLEEIEYGRLVTALREKLEKGQYHQEVEQDSEWLKQYPEPLPPPELQEVGYWEMPDWGRTDPFSGYGTSTGTGGPGGPLPTLDPKVQQLQREHYQKVQAWRRQVNIEATRRYRQELSEGRQKAKEQAGRAVSVDLSVLRGRGSEFVLEFTTVVVIIFAAVALGVLRILDTQQIGTLLAAIAGYVLGRATSRTQTKTGEGVVTETETRTQVNITELAELLQAVRGTAPSTPPPTPAPPTPPPTPPTPTPEPTPTPPTPPTPTPEPTPKPEPTPEPGPESKA